MNNSKENQIKNLLMETVGHSHYNGWHNRTTYGYHSYTLDDVDIKGQRTPAHRLQALRDAGIDFTDKRVLDCGCNVGAMLHHLPEIKWGMGLDYDAKCIHAAKGIAEVLGVEEKLRFFVHDFDRMNYDIFTQRVSFTPDYIFLLSLGSWIQSWQELYKTCDSMLLSSGKVILEINNEVEGRDQLNFFTNLGREPQLIIDNSLDDTTGNNLRRTYLV